MVSSAFSLRSASCLATLLAVCVGCAPTESPYDEEVLPASGPVARAKRLSPPLDRRAGKTVSIHLTEGTKLRDVLDLKVFGSLVPGMTCKEASIALGVRGQYVESCTFELASAQMYVAYEPGTSSLATFHRRTLYAYPKPPNNDANAILSSHLQQYRAVAAPGIILELIVAERGDNERAWVLVDGDIVKSINWWSPASRRPPARPAQ